MCYQPEILCQEQHCSRLESDLKLPQRGGYLFLRYGLAAGGSHEPRERGGLTAPAWAVLRITPDSQLHKAPYAANNRVIKGRRTRSDVIQQL